MCPVIWAPIDDNNGKVINDEKHTYQVTIKKIYGVGLASKDASIYFSSTFFSFSLDGLSDPYLILNVDDCITGKRKEKSSTCFKTLHPEWNILDWTL